MGTAKGALTQKKLLTIAKKNFYEYGYKKTTIAKIAEEAGISAGNLTYYYPSKDKIVEAIFDEYNEKIISFTEKRVLDKDEEFYIEKKYICSGMIFNANILKDEKTSEFFKHVVETRSLYDIVAKMMDPMYREITQKYSLRLSSPLIYHYITRADQGARRGMLLTYIEDNKKIPELDISMLMMHYSSQLIGIPEKTYYRIGLPCFNKLSKTDFSHINLLKK